MIIIHSFCGLTLCVICTWFLFRNDKNYKNNILTNNIEIPKDDDADLSISRGKPMQDDKFETENSLVEFFPQKHKYHTHNEVILFFIIFVFSFSL